MIVASIIIGILMILFILIWFSTITIVINYAHKMDDDHLYIQFRLWKIIRYKITVPMVKLDKDAPNITYEKNTNTGKHEQAKITPEEISSRLSDFKELLLHVFELRIIVRKFLKTIKINQLDWHTTIGLKDAALTGTLTGVVWSIKGMIVGFLSKYMQLMSEPHFSVHSSFQIPISQTSIECMFKMRIGNAILAGLKIVKFWRGGKASFKTKPLSTISKDETKQSV